VSHDGACFYLAVWRWLKTASLYEKFSLRRLLRARGVADGISRGVAARGRVVRFFNALPRATKVQ
jgi:hypothetical protein